MQFRARFIANIIQFAVHQGASRKSFLEILGKKMEDLEDENLFFEAGIYNRIVEQALKETNDPYFGLHLGEYLSLSAAGLIMQIVQSSRTVREGLNYVVEFANLGCQAMPFRLERVGEEWELSLHPNPVWEEQSPLAVRHTMDGTVVFTLREFHSLTHHKYDPKRIHFAYPRPKKNQEYERLFTCPVRYEQEVTALYLDPKQLEESVVTSDYHLLQILVHYAENKLLSLANEEGFASVVRQSIVNLVKPQFPSIEQVAANLNISVRTLQRRLKEENYTFKSLLDRLRQQFALDYLNNNALSIKEIAYLLDYSDSSSFIRSFQRWKGESPEIYRRKMLHSSEKRTSNVPD